MSGSSAQEWCDPEEGPSPLGTIGDTPTGAIAPAPVRRAKRSTPIRLACVRCRRSKVKCDGKHASCSRCLKQSKQCVYDVPKEGMTKMEYLQQEIKRTVDASNALLELFQHLRSATDHDATALLARLRAGEPVASMLASLDAPHEVAVVESMPDNQSEASVTRTQHRPSIVSNGGWESECGPAMPIQHSALDTHWMPEIDDNVQNEEMWRMREDKVNLRWERGGLPQITFQGIEWPD